MRITDIAITHHRLRLDPPFFAAWDSRPRTEFVASVVRVRTDDGVTGIGSGDAMPGFCGHEHLFVGTDPLELERHFKIIENLSFHYGRCWPLDLALWDLYGKVTSQPCWRLLGGQAQRVPLYASSAVTRGREAMAELAERYLAEGFTAMKVRFHARDWRSDLARLEAIRGTVGNRLVLMVDCNQAWRMPWDTSDSWTLDDARVVARQLEELDVYWMEEPLHRADFDGMRALRREARVRIAAGEMARELHDLRELVLRGCVDVLQPDATLIGGFTGLSAIARLAQANGVVFTPHTWGNGVGLMANAQLAGGLGQCPYLEFPYDPPQWSPARRDFPLTEPIAPDPDGFLSLPDRPGLGLTLDEQRLVRTRI